MIYVFLVFLKFIDDLFYSVNFVLFGIWFLSLGFFFGGKNFGFGIKVNGKLEGVLIYFLIFWVLKRIILVVFLVCFSESFLFIELRWIKKINIRYKGYKLCCISYNLEILVLIFS